MGASLPAAGLGEGPSQGQGGGGKLRGRTEGVAYTEGECTGRQSG